MPSPLLSRKCAQTLLCQTSCSGFKLLFEEYCRRFPVKCLCDPHLLKHSSPCPYLISEWCAYSEGVCLIIIPIISGILPHSPSAEWCRMNFHPVRQRSEAMRRCGDAAIRRHRRLTASQQVEIQASHYAKCKCFHTPNFIVKNDTKKGLPPYVLPS